MQPQVQLNNQYPFTDSPVRHTLTFNLATKLSDFTSKVNHHQRNLETQTHNLHNVYASNSLLHPTFNRIAVPQFQNLSTKRNYPKSGNFSKFCYQNNLPSIIPQEQTRKNAQFQQTQKSAHNIFKSDITQRLRYQQLQKGQAYMMIGRKQIKNYQSRVFKKRNHAKRTESLISISKFSTTVKSSEQKNGYMNREDVLIAMSPIQMSQTYNFKQNERSVSSLNKLRQKIQKYHRIWAVQKKEMQKNQHNLNIRRPADFFKMDLSMQKVIKTGDLSSLSVLNSHRACKSRLDQSMAKTRSLNRSQANYESILDLVDDYRQKVQNMQQLCLNQQKKYASQNVWPLTLRSQSNMKNYYAQKASQKTHRILKDNGFKLRGREKLKNQLKWINQKNNHVFQAIDKEKLTIEGVYKKNNVSQVNNTIKQYR